MEDCASLKERFKKLAIHQISYSGFGTKSGGPLGGEALKGHHVNRRIEYGELSSIVEFKEMVKFAEDRLMYKN